MKAGYILKQDFWTVQQHECFVKTCPLPLAAILMDPRTGKSKPIVDTACYHYERPSSPLHCLGVLIIAWPAGVHRQWITDAFPENVPDRIPWKGFIWRSALWDRKYVQKAFDELLAFKGLAVLSVNAEALVSEDCRKAITRFLKARKRVGAVADEASFMVTADSKRQRVMYNISKQPEIVWKRILDGTPVARMGPLDYFTLIRWLSPTILGHTTSITFRNHFAEMDTEGDWVYRTAKQKAFPEMYDRAIRSGHDPDEAETIADTEAHKLATKRPGAKFWPVFVKDEETGLPKFKNMDELWAKLDPITYRATFEQCFNTPRKIFQKHYFQLTDEQRRVYTSLRDEYKAELVNGDLIEVNHHLTRVLRLQQIASNYFPATKGIANHESCHGAGCEECEWLGVVEVTTPMRVIDHKHNPRLNALRQELSHGNPTIIWARFRQDIDQIVELCEELKLDPVRYDGAVKPAAQAKAKDDFQAGKSRAFCASCSFTSGATRGIPLWKASGHVFYSNSFSWRTREQAEQRAEIKHRTVGTSVVDLVAEDTVDDTLIIPALRAAKDVAAYVMRDLRGEWI